MSVGSTGWEPLFERLYARLAAAAVDRVLASRPEAAGLPNVTEVLVREARDALARRPVERATGYWITGNRYHERRRVIEADFEAPAGAGLEELILEARAQGLASSIFEIQTERGIWSARGRTNRPLSPSNAHFHSWEDPDDDQAEPERGHVDTSKLDRYRQHPRPRRRV